LSDLRFDGRVAVVTGAGGGLGHRHALAIAARGARVVVNDVHAGDAARVAKEIEDRGGTAISNSDALDTPEDGQAVIHAAMERFGAVDIVVHQTEGPSDVGSSHGMLTERDPVELLASLFGGYWLTRAAWTHMRAQEYGRIVLSCSFDRSIDGAMEVGNEDGNTVAGMGLVGLMNILKVEGRDHGVKVNMIVPKATRDFDAAANAVTYLAHEECAPSGEIFTVHGGGLARMFVGVTAGYYAPDLSSDIVRDRVAEYLDPTGFIVPDDASGEIALLLRDLKPR
jgi:NAD(P)-dependent dehydrogenase (short-subunit alcohol dehydrogenase family)